MSTRSRALVDDGCFIQGCSDEFSEFHTFQNWIKNKSYLTSKTNTYFPLNYMSIIRRKSKVHLSRRACWYVLSPTYFPMSHEGTDSFFRKRGLFMCQIASLFLLQRLKGSMSGVARDFNNMETGAVIKFLFFARQGAEGNSRHSDRNISLFPSWSG